MLFDDLPLNRPPDPTPGRAPAASATSRWLIVGAGTVVAGSLLALWWMSRAQPPTATPAPTSAVEAQGARRPPRQPMELPALAESDSMLRELVATLSRNPLLARLLATRGLVRGVTLAIVQIGDGKTPVVPLVVLRPSVRLEIAGAESGPVEPASSARWEAAARALQSIPAADAAQVYVNVKPLFDEAYRELGYPDGDFDQAIVKAIRMLDGTPESPAALVLLRREGYFEHEDPTLRSIPPVQKQLLLMGRENRGRVVAWLHQLAATLELRITG